MDFWPLGFLDGVACELLDSVAPSSENPPGSDSAAEVSSSISRICSRIGGLSALGIANSGWEGISPGSNEFSAWVMCISLRLAISGGVASGMIISGGGSGTFKAEVLAPWTELTGDGFEG